MKSVVRDHHKRIYDLGFRLAQIRSNAIKKEKTEAPEFLPIDGFSKRETETELPLKTLTFPTLVAHTPLDLCYQCELSEIVSRGVWVRVSLRPISTES